MPSWEMQAWDEDDKLKIDVHVDGLGERSREEVDERLNDDDQRN